MQGQNLENFIRQLKSDTTLPHSFLLMNWGKIILTKFVLFNNEKKIVIMSTIRIHILIL